MAFDTREDQTAPVSRQEVMLSVDQEKEIHQVVVKILNALNEKRDSYDGVINSIRWVISTQDGIMIAALQKGLIRDITSSPMTYGGKMFISKTKARLVDEEPKFMIELFENIVLVTDWCKDFSHRSEILRLQIISIKTIIEASQKGGSRQTIIEQGIIDNLCNDAIHNGDDATKIDTLSLILESRSTTKPLDHRLLKQFEISFKDALSLQEPALRQMFLSQTNKLLKRLKDSHRVVLRDKKMFSDDERSKITETYLNFLTWLIEFCFDSIYCNAYFGSFILTISTLNLIIKHITFSDRELPIESLFNSKRCYDSVLSCLNDSFEENKSRSLGLLSSLPPNDDFLKQENLDLFEKLAYRLSESVNPAHSLTCQYLFKLIVDLSVKMGRGTKNDLLFGHLERLTDMVEEGLRETRDNFVIALKQQPIYPKLSCIRALLDEIQVAHITESRDKWQLLAERIIDSSIDACQAVSSIVCNLNPETIGHLPMDLNPIDTDTLSRTMNISLNISESDMQTISSQMLLISGWKTIKECSLSMGAITTLFWWPKERIKEKKEKYPGLSMDTIVGPGHLNKILTFFDHYLRNLRHRGAFEQAYNGFMIVTKRVWHDDGYRAALVKTLENIMGDFRDTVEDEKKADCLRAYVTRRSAGLPFIVQAILNSEHKHDSRTFRWIMDSLFVILDKDDLETYQRIHCLNILRALVKEHFLGEKVTPYIGKTFEITMDCFNSDLFPIRNCANMLLKAIVDRTFGVNRLRNDIHRRNQLSFERFFTECPRLHGKMLDHLYNGQRSRKYLAAVHSVFIILFRLVPSLNPGPDYRPDKVIVPFIGPIEDLANNCPDYKLRELAAKLTVRLRIFSSDPKLHNIRDNFDLLCGSLHSSDTKLNTIHGRLAELKYLIESRAEIPNTDENLSLLRSTPAIICRICLSSEGDGQDSPLTWPIKSTAMDLAESYCLNFPEEDHSWLPDLVPFLEQYATSSSLSLDCRQPMYENFLFKLSSLLLIGLINLKMGHFKFTSGSETVGQLDGHISKVVGIIMSFCLDCRTDTTSPSFRGALLRLVRQLMEKSDDNDMNHLLNKLDVDLTAAFMTPIDKLKTREEFDLTREKIRAYCKQRGFEDELRQLVGLNLGPNYVPREFVPTKGSKFSAKSANTARSIELLAILGSELDLPPRSFTIELFYQILSDLPDCDVKCVAILCASKALNGHLGGGNASIQFTGITNLCRLIDGLADGDHSLTIREACCIFLKQTIHTTIKFGLARSELRESLVSLLSALIKLSQDEDLAIRSICHKIILDLSDESSGHLDESATNNQKDVDAGPAVGSRLDKLIKLITCKLFEPNIEEQLNCCTDLLLRIVFNHANNYSSSNMTGDHSIIDEPYQKERLFDKTKLNTFADHVAIINSSIHGLETFFRRRVEKPELNSLRLADDILEQLKEVDRHHEEGSGDYSWRLRKVIKGLAAKTNPDVGEPTAVYMLNNERVFEKFLANLLESLAYFSDGYTNMLIDNEYTYNELSLFRRVAFVRFVKICTKFQLEDENLMASISQRLEEMTQRSCCTTLLHKCRLLLQ